MCAGEVGTWTLKVVAMAMKILVEDVEKGGNGR